MAVNPDTRTGTKDFAAAAAGALAAQSKPSGRATALPSTSFAAEPPQPPPQELAPPPAPSARLTPVVEDKVFGDNGLQLFGPGTPLRPLEPQPVRYIDFQVGINRNPVPRSAEVFGFAQLRAFANIELARLAVETRKEQIEALDWNVRIKDPLKGEKGITPASREMEAFLARPDGINGFSTWVRMLLEEMLVLDAPCIERLRTRSGQLYALMIVPGDTIKPLVDTTGRRPVGQNVPAYQQWIRGKVWCDLSSEDLIYLPRNPRPGKVYGYGPIEQCLVTIQTILARQVAQLGYFTDGNIPAGILTGPEGWTPQQLQEMQDAFNVLMKGDPNHHHNLIWTPFGTKYQSFKDSPLKDEFDEWLARIIMYAFNLPPTPFIRAMNRSTASNDTERGAEEGLMPIKLWLKRLLDWVIQTDLHHPELEFVWANRTEVNAKEQAEVDDKYLRNGSATINEIRDQRGMTPIPDGDTPLIYSPSGVLPLSLTVNPPPPPPPGPSGQPGAAKGPAGPSGAKQTAKPAASAKLAKAGLTSGKALGTVSAARPKAQRHKAEIRDAAAHTLSRVGATASAELERRLRAMHKAADPLGQALDATDDEATAKTQGRTLADLMTLGGLSALTLTIYPPLVDLYRDAAVQAHGTTGADDEPDFDTGADDYATTRSASIVAPGDDTGIEQSTRDMVEGVIAAGLFAGLGATAIADAVQASYAFSQDRADAIAETEGQDANGAGAEAGYLAAMPYLTGLGLVLTKVWETAGDDKVEETCLGNEADGAIPFDQAFASGDTWVPAHNRCRCDISVFVATPA